MPWFVDLNCVLDQLSCQHYADDTVVYYAYNSLNLDVENTINNDLDKVNNWCKSNKLSLNTKKTKVVHFGTQSLLKHTPKPALIINNEIIQSTVTYRYLGITLDNLLSYKQHVQNLTRNVNFKNNLFRKIRLSLTQKSAVDVLTLMILPSIDYGDIIYSSAIKTELNHLQSAFDRGLRTTYLNEDTINAKKLTKLAEINSLIDRREYHLELSAFKLTLEAQELDNRLIFTRLHDGKLLHTIWPKNPHFRKSLRFRQAMSWNSFHKNIRNIDNYASFVIKRKEFYSTKLTNDPTS